MNENPFNDFIKKFNESVSHVKNTQENLSDEDAALILELVLDALIEVGNGTTEKHLHEACDLLFKFRDKWFKERVKK